jgi:hypothetical protein
MIYHKEIAKEETRRYLILRWALPLFSLLLASVLELSWLLTTTHTPHDLQSCLIYQGKSKEPMGI